ncbi:MAG: Cd2+/Zn2+-exporting ATPase [Halothiobacillaceae bacterium]|nr:MAG: Cd2+/Zn2+-exporting ATPase [Halothiobacillaceae bacterium]
MAQSQLRVKNVKCGGCATNIRDGLASLPGVVNVEVAVASGEVTITGEGVDLTQVSAKLAALGYPVVTN